MLVAVVYLASGSAEQEEKLCWALINPTTIVFALKYRLTSTKPGCGVRGVEVGAVRVVFASRSGCDIP